MLLGCARGYWLSTEPGPTRTVVSAVLWGFFLENVLFPSQHQEYGVLSLEAWRAGAPTAEPILLEFAARQLGLPGVNDAAVAGFALPVDSWVYPLWIVAAGVLTLVAARHFVGARWTATAIAAGYLAYRMVSWTLLVGTAFPPSIPPFLLLGGAVMVDLAFLAIANGYIRAAIGAMLATIATAAFAAIQELAIGAPPIDYPAFLLAGVFLAVAWAGLGGRLRSSVSSGTLVAARTAPESVGGG